MERIIDLRNMLVKKLEECNKELSKLMGKKSVYGDITIFPNDLIDNGWLEFHFSQAKTNR